MDNNIIETIDGINIIAEGDGVVLTDRKCKHCGKPLRFFEVLDYTDTCLTCSYKI